MSSSCPSKFTQAVLFVFKIFSFICICVLLSSRLFPNSFTRFHAIFKYTWVWVPIDPTILSVASSFTVVVLTQINVSICKCIGPLAMSQCKLPFTLISVPVWPLMNTVTMRLVFMPLSNIRITIISFPNTIAMFLPYRPLPIVCFSICPCIEAFSTDFTIIVISQVLVTVTEFFISLAITKITQPTSFINSSIFIATYTEAVTLFFNYLTPVDGVSVAFNMKVLGLFKQVEIKKIGLHIVV